MRKPINPQMPPGEIDISAIQLDPRSRDDVPRILKGLQHLYTTPGLRQAVLVALEKMMPKFINKKMVGRAWISGEYWFLTHFG